MFSRRTLGIISAVVLVLAAGLLGYGFVSGQIGWAIAGLFVSITGARFLFAALVPIEKLGKDGKDVKKGDGDG